MNGSTVNQPKQRTTVVELVRWRAMQQPDQLTYTFLTDSDSATGTFSYAELDRRARSISVQWQQMGATGQPVVLGYPPGLDDIAAFFGCLYADAVAIPAYPPTSARLQRTLPQRLLAIVRDAQPLIALTTVATVDLGRVQDYPLPLISENVQPDRDPSRHPLFQVVFALQATQDQQERGLSAFAFGKPGAQMQLGNLTIKSIALDRQIAQFDLTLMLAESENTLIGTWEYTVDRFEAATIERMPGHFQTLLAGIVANPEQPIPDLALLTQAEPRQIDKAHQQIQEQAAELQASLDLASGPLLRIALFYAGPAPPAHLLVTIHQLAVNRRSWHILLEDLSTAYQQRNQSAAVDLPAHTASFKQGAARLAAQTDSQETLGEQDYWQQILDERVAPLPRNLGSPDAANIAGSTATIRTALDAETTRELLEVVQEAYHAEPVALLLAVLACHRADWSGDQSLLELQQDACDTSDEKLDLSRTVGWCATGLPLRLTVDPAKTYTETLKAVKETLRQVPGRGAHYGLLRHLHAQTADQLRLLPGPEIRVGYWGQIGSRLPFEASWRMISEQRELGSPDVFTPSDFPLSGLNQEDLSRFLSSVRRRF